MNPIEPFELNDIDHARLASLRLDRLRILFPIVNNATLMLDSLGHLHIICSCPKIWQSVVELSQLQPSEFWIVSGAQKIIVQKQNGEKKTFGSSANLDVTDMKNGGTGMTSAVIEKPTVATAMKHASERISQHLLLDGVDAMFPVEVVAKSFGRTEAETLEMFERIGIQTTKLMPTETWLVSTAALADALRTSSFLSDLLTQQGMSLFGFAFPDSPPTSPAATPDEPKPDQKSRAAKPKASKTSTKRKPSRSSNGKNPELVEAITETNGTAPTETAEPSSATLPTRLKGKIKVTANRPGATLNSLIEQLGIQGNSEMTQLVLSDLVNNEQSTYRKRLKANKAPVEPVVKAAQRLLSKIENNAE